MSSEQNKVILRAEHISKTYGEKKVLEDISIIWSRVSWFPFWESAVPERPHCSICFPVLSRLMKERSI